MTLPGFSMSDATMPTSGPSWFARRRETLVPIAAAVLSALLLVATFPPYNLWPLGWLSIAPLYVALTYTPRLLPAFRVAWLFGVPVFLIGAYWMLELGGSIELGIVPWAMLAFIEALPFGIQAVFVGMVAPRLPRGHILRPILFAAVWVAGEWMRGWGKVAFPWFLLASSQIHAPLPLLQVMSLTGQWGLSFAVALCCAFLGEAWMIRRESKRGAVGRVCIALAIPLLLGGFGEILCGERMAQVATAESDGSSITIAGIQGNVGKEAADNRASEDYRSLVMDTYIGLTRTAANGLEKPDLIVWPETVVPEPLLMKPDLLNAVETVARQIRTPLLVGTVDVQPIHAPGTAAPTLRYTNTGILFDNAGTFVDRYDKMQIVPIGEYFPLRSILGTIYTHYGVPPEDLEPGDASGLLQIPILANTRHGAGNGIARVGAMICYDDVFPTQARERVRLGAGVLTLMTSDDTFGDTSGPQQHADLDVLRAIETARYLVRAAATGPSEIVTPTGAVESIRPLGQRGIVQRRLPLMKGETLFVRWGDWFAWGCTLIAAGSGALAFVRRNKTPHKGE